MGRRKIDIKYIEDRITRQTIFQDVERAFLGRLMHSRSYEVAVLVISPTNIPYTCGKPCFDNMVERIQNPSASSILRSQAKLDRLMKELEQIKEREEEIVDMKLEDLVAFKGKLEALQADLKRKDVEMEALSSPMMLPKNTKKKKMRTKFSSEQSFLPDRIYDLRPRTLLNYLE